MFFREASFQGKEAGVHVDGELLYVCVCVGGEKWGSDACMFWKKNL